MKINNIKLRDWRFLLLGLSILLFTYCDKEVEVFNPEDLKINTSFPDLRFANIADAYSYPASQAIADSFDVKSLYHKWEIIGTAKSPWYQITPSSGEAATLYRVGIVPDDNTVLDDRVDTLTLISEGWEGKTFVIFQKGTAYLSASAANPTLAEYVGDHISIDVSSNQDWSAVVEEGIDWMAIDGSSSGNGDGTISLVSLKDNGSLRKSGQVFVYDRNDLIADTVTIYQQGLYLEVVNAPGQIAIAGGNLEVGLNANTDWNLTIPESAQSWLSVDKTSGNGDETLTFTVQPNIGLSRSVYVKLESDPPLVMDSILFDQQGEIPFTEEFWHANASVTFNSDGSATLYAAPKTGSKYMKSKLEDFSYGKYTVTFENIQIAQSSSTMLMCITTADKFNGGISWGAIAKTSYSDGWASEYWISDSFGSKMRQRVDNDILRADIKKYVIDVRKSETPGMVNIDYYINDQLLVSEEGLDGFAKGDPMVLSFWIYNYYEKEVAAIFQPKSLVYEPYKY